MQATDIDGKAYADNLSNRISSILPSFENRTGRMPGLAVVLVGSDPASEIYVRSKNRKAQNLGMESFVYTLAETTSQSDLLTHIEALNADDRVDGILVQLPLPAHLDEMEVINAIDPDKDVDGLHPVNSGRLLAGCPGFVSCTPLGCLMLLRDHLGKLAGMDAIVIGRSILVGKPMAQLLLNENCTVTCAHSRTEQLAQKARQADIVVSAVGKAGFVKEDWIKPGATIIDVGTTKVVIDGRKRLLGDVDYQAVREIAGAITPVPGGVGPMTIAVLMHNTLLAAHRRSGLEAPAL
ncbi:MAG: bifunctional methylenetetrahydrofolate dehydrogenase/methenyltetrahydrofolate cyclohydrolase FolD [Roseibium sp.]|uniref:bifunctional methylenetetrahydrofolate dehydrogenase/methenyltetrahydrofolate cyclohydrolase FolD n=1 Tax=Roseibium sp. TaxID=1936156 RepID=UPI00260607B2|nr:bifunctional methylenetetrahydrofolate dehydrogenase/methenyltetrahydrofolate cyclohydrolase FolD [Roseibium sp.]MCV0423999.1 bifunctional methylenetetrahydrofolate dehydrogenase/methenyltetrahydrofolate cyclohydrolase FolD [Roseibium sp.]